MPSGAAGTAPDVDDLLLNTFGVRTIVGGVSVAYTPTDSQSARGSFSMTHIADDVVSRGLAGCVIDTFKINASGTDETKLSFEGRAVDGIHTGRSTLFGASAGQDITVVAADADNFEVGSVLQIGTSTNSGLGHRVSVKVANLLTVLGTLSPQGNGLVVAPFAPTETTAGVPTAMTIGSLTLTGFTGSLPITQFELTLKNNLKMHEDEAFQVNPTDVTYGRRDVTGSITVRARADQILRLGNYRNAISTTRDAVVTIGSGAGTTLVIDIDRIEIDQASIEFPEQDEAMIQLPFVALATSAGANEVSMTYT